MKKILLTLFTVTAFGFVANAQDDDYTEDFTHYRVGVHVGAPIGNSGDLSSFNFGLDIAYMMPINEDIAAGVASGYTHYTAKGFNDVLMSDMKDFGFIPLAGTAQFRINEGVFFTGDFGYAFLIGGDDNQKGGLYYQPKIVYEIEDWVDSFGFFKGIKAGDDTINTIGLGLAFKF